MRTRRLEQAAVVLVALILLYAAAGFLLAPWLAERRLGPMLQERLGRVVSVGALRANPFLLSLEVRDVSIDGKHGSPVIAFDHLSADLDWAGLFRRTWTVDTLSLQGVRIHLVREPDGTLNLAQLAQRLAGAGSESGQGAQAAVLRQLDVPQASLVITDLTGAQPASATLAPLNLQANGLSNIANRRAAYSLSAVLPGGGALESEGGAVLQPALEAAGKVQLRGLQAATLWPFVRDRLRLSEMQGSANVSASYAYGAGQSLRLDGMAIDLADVLLARAGEDGRLLAMKRITAGGGSLDLAGRAAALATLAFEGGETKVALAPDGRVNWALAAEPQVASRAISARKAAPGWTLEVAALSLGQLGFHYQDRSRRTPLVLVLDGGTIDGRARLRLSLGASSTQVALENLEARLQQIELATPGIPQQPFTLASASIAQGYLDLAGQRMGASELVLQGGAASIVRGADGRFSLRELLAPATGVGTGQDKRALAPPSASRPKGWHYAFDLVKLESLGLKLADGSFKPPLALGTTLQASAINVARDRPAAFEAALSLAPGGTIQTSGTANVQTQVEVAGLALAPLQPMLARFAALDMRSGAASVSTQLRYQGGAQASLQAQGRLGIAYLLVNEAGSGQRFLSWQQLDADGVAFNLVSRRLTVQEVTVNAPGAKIEIAKDRSVNLAQVFRRGKPARQRAEQAGAQPKAPAAQDAARWSPEVERVRLLGGNVDYADLSLVLPFSTTVTALNGTIVGISNDRSHRADIKASGTIEPYGSASVSGGIAPFAPSQFTDLRVAFNNVLVPPLSPYTATFAGRKVESGKLWLDLEYKIADGELLGKNEIRLADFTLGERVEAPSAISVPLDLAVALLTVAKGETHLSVPVRGDLDNPSFSVASAVRQALGNVLQRMVSAPFRALGRLFGGNAESLAAIDFEPGSAALLPEQREKLDALTRALQERPRLRLVVSAPYSPQTDALALQREQARRDLAQALGRRLEANEDPVPIAYDDPATRRALERMLREQAGADAVRQLYTDFAGASDAKRRLYEAMFDKIAARRVMGASAMQLLAAQRARAIAGYLVQQGVGRERVQTGRILAVQDASAGAVSAQLQVEPTEPTG